MKTILCSRIASTQNFAKYWIGRRFRWERGSGETLACGTGACAATISSILNGYTDTQVTVKLLGGDLKVFWDRDADQVYMTGPAVEVFSGNIELQGGNYV